MTNFASVDQILDFAIEKEDQAVRFYTGLAAGMEKPWMRELFRDFADQELRHKTKLEEVRAGGQLRAAADKVADLRLADYLADVDVVDGGKMTYAEALNVAMKREKAAFKLYADLAAATDDQRLKDAFLSLAHEEAKHKLYLEVQYDETILTEN
ncbi:Rubrerythrin [Desulfarculus baarsii DSM 2075]|uniref:Rubrerythrin n=1 Tax=Desulfarculus baarsii (strain ATCC 33931 / DSM 2075 / LMG 7858 / VKM B-1802 / 2st14) TaxID=644282 RepID=E1QEG8_DESB2|nr:ferritin family protein [Desulfarculus baarsii]ADK83954.1 Rubrerythrin [Desulfarculus baarsii DSM 2075]